MGGDKHVRCTLPAFQRCLHGAMLGNLFHQLFGVEALLLGDFLEERVDLDQHVVVHDLPNEGDGKQRLNTRGCTGDDGDSAGRGDGGNSGISDRFFPRSVENGALEVGEWSAQFCQFAGGRHALRR